MSLPITTSQVLQAAGYDPLADFMASMTRQEVSLKWHHADPQPTDQQINDWANDVTPLPSGETYSEHVAARQALRTETADEKVAMKGILTKLRLRTDTVNDRRRALRLIIRELLQIEE